MIHFLAPKNEDFTIRDYLEEWGRDFAGRMTVLHYEELPDRRSASAGTYVFSAIDRLLPAGRRFAGEFADQLSKAGPGFRVANSPERAIGRLRLLEELHRRGLNRHRAARAEDGPAGLRFPLFLREENDHLGAMSALLASAEEVRDALSRAILRGHRLQDLLLVEYCDTAGADGLYRKYAAFIVGKEIVPRHLLHGRDWMLKHAASEFSPSLALEERAYVLENPHEGQLRRLFEIAGVDYGRIDYAVKDGAIETWEINLNPTIGARPRASSNRIPPEIQPLRRPAKEHFYRRFRSALESFDSTADAPPIPIRFVEPRPSTPRALTRQEPNLRRPVLRKLLRPLRKPIDRLASLVAPLFMTLSRRRR